MVDVSLRQEVYQDLVQVISELSGVKKERILPSSSLYSEIGLDSLNVQELLTTMEIRYRHLGLDCDVDFDSLRTVEDVHGAVVSRISDCLVP